MAELERKLESAYHESQDQAMEVIGVQAVELLAVEQVTTTEWGLEAAKVRQAETEAALQKSLANTKVALQRSLETEQNALELERKARSEADQQVLALRGRVIEMEEANARLCE